MKEVNIFLFFILKKIRWLGLFSSTTCHLDQQAWAEVLAHTITSNWLLALELFRIYCCENTSHIFFMLILSKCKLTDDPLIQNWNTGPYSSKLCTVRYDCKLSARKLNCQFPHWSVSSLLDVCDQTPSAYKPEQNIK